MRIKLYFIFLLCITFYFFRPIVIYAHDMRATTSLCNDGTVLIDVFFEDGFPVKKANIEIFKPDGSLFARGSTDQNGHFIFSPFNEHTGRWKLVAFDKLGHRTETKIEIPDLNKFAKEKLPKIKKKQIYKKVKVPWFKIIAGLGFIFGLSSFIMSLSLKTKLKNR